MRGEGPSESWRITTKVACVPLSPNQSINLLGAPSHRTNRLAELTPVFFYGIRKVGRLLLKSLQACDVEHWNIGINVQLVLKTRAALVTRLGPVVALQWIPSHCGLRGNEFALKAAAAGHETPTSVLSVPFHQN